MPNWTPIVVLPNIDLRGSIESNRAALVPATDTRIHDLWKTQPVFKEFLSRFRDAFGTQIWPAVILFRDDAPKTFFTSEAIAGFRDAIAAAVIPYSRARRIKYDAGRDIAFSDSFALYPWMLDRNYKYITAQHPAMLALHVVEEFGGQCAPEVPLHSLFERDIDIPLVKELLRRWEICFSRRYRSWPERVLFRSLNMAYQASRIPALAETTAYDYGRTVGLWVSALEILAHPRHSQSNLILVYDLLEGTRWQTAKCKAKRYAAFVGKRPNQPRRTIASWLYGELYQARNDYLHGNRVLRGRLRLRQSTRSLFDYAGPLYRIALTSFLDLGWKAPVPPTSDIKAFTKAVVDRSGFLKFQIEIEEAIATARGFKP